MPSSSETVLAVVPNYNGGKALLECVRSLQDQSHPNVKVVVVDNCSTDNSLDLLKTDFPHVTVIATGYNAGWGVACNVGMNHEASDYILLANNDAWLDVHCVTEMIEAIESDASYGSCAVKILQGADTGLVEACGLVIVKDGSSCGRGRFAPAADYDEQVEVFCANDCVCLYKRHMIDDIGDYDPDFFIYCDETDMGFKHQIAGWKCIYAPGAVAYHHHSLAAGSVSDLKAFYVERNHLFLLLKYFPLDMIISGLVLSVLRHALQVFYAARAKRGKLAQYLEKQSIWHGAGVLWRAYLAAIRMAPVMLRRRWGMRRIRRISGRDFRKLFTQFGISICEMARYE